MEIALNSALYSTSPSPRMSDQYEFMPTSNLIDHCVKHGYEVAKYSQTRCRKPELAPYTKHMVTLQRVGVVPVVDDVVPQVLIINSHNGSSTLQFLLGFFRFICTNGLVSGDIFADFGKIRHKHSNPFAAVLDTVDKVYETANKRVETIQQMKEVQLSFDETIDFCNKVTTLMPERVIHDPITLNHWNRPQDQGDSLWLTFNRIQENLMKGNIKILNSRSSERKARPIKSIDKNISINQGLWNIATQYLPHSPIDIEGEIVQTT